MLKNEVVYIFQSNRKSFATRVILILLILMFISSLNSINSNNSVKNSRTKSKNQLLSNLNKNRNQRSMVRVKTVLTSENIKEIVQAHNDVRNKVAMGQTIKGNSLPKAANMLQFYWSPTIAKGAQQWADRCAMGHSPREKRKYKGKGLGENIAMYPSDSKKKNTSQFTKMVNLWFDEIKNFNESVDKFQLKGLYTYGHFTQVSWAQSYLVGCGYCKAKGGRWDKEFLVCQYFNAGNVINGPIYQVKKGNECQCPEGHACKNPDYPGLCCPNDLKLCNKNSFLWTE